MATKKILLFGQTGIEKSRCGKRLVTTLRGLASQEYLEKYPASFLSLEEEIVAGGGSEGAGIHFYFTRFNLSEQKRIWDRAAERVLRKLEEHKPSYSVISLHGTFFFSYHFKTFITRELIETLQPAVAFTLINDIYYIKDQIDRNPKNKEHGVKIKYEDILSWRSVECMVADWAVANTNIQGLDNIVISTKQGVKTFVDIVENPKCLKIYLSFPIGSTRLEERRRNLINEVRYFLHEKFVCFDPLGIDEKRLKIKDCGDCEVNDCWDFGFEDNLCIGEANPDPNAYGNENGWKALVDIIDSHIRNRDYRLIDQSDCVVICRPFSSIEGLEGKKGFSRGVWSEVKYAQSTNKPVFLFDDIVTDAGSSSSPFETCEGIAHIKDFGELERTLQGLSDNKSKT